MGRAQCLSFSSLERADHVSNKYSRPADFLHYASVAICSFVSLFAAASWAWPLLSARAKQGENLHAGVVHKGKDAKTPNCEILAMYKNEKCTLLYKLSDGAP